VNFDEKLLTFGDCYNKKVNRIFDDYQIEMNEFVADAYLKKVLKFRFR